MLLARTSSEQQWRRMADDPTNDALGEAERALA